MDIMAVWAFKITRANTSLDCVGALALNGCAPLDGKPLQARFTFNKPGEGHRFLANRILEIVNFAECD